MTTKFWGVREAAEGCARAGIRRIGLWRDKVGEIGLRESERIVRDCGLDVSSLCRGGMFPASTQAEITNRLDDNRQAVDEAVAVGAEVLVLVCGAAPNRDLDAARGMVEQGLEHLLPYAADARVKLGIEPLHPVFAADRSVIVTLSQANDLIERLSSPWVGMIIDVFHVWWDPNLYTEISRAAGHIFGLHVNDWLTTRNDLFVSRGMMGDGTIELSRIREAVDAAGYDGPIEAEILNDTIWSMPGDRVLELVRESFLAHVVGEKASSDSGAR